MQEINNTQYFKVQKDQEIEVKDVIAQIYEALTEKGYNPVNQIVGYVMSGDPTYITSHKGARSLIRIRKVKPVSSRYPRKAGMPGKEPLGK